MSHQPLPPRLVHPLPPTPHFVGRTSELAELRTCWNDCGRGVVALIGLGGAGKTALASRFLEQLADRPERRPDGLFVWSFYQEPDAGLCLQEAYRYFAPLGADVPARGLGLLHLLQDALRNGGPHLLVLDGLERVQRQADGGQHGQLEEPLLKALLSQIAEGVVPAAVVITSRFPLSDLEQGRGYRQIDVGGLDMVAAVALLRRRGVRGDDETLLALVERYGAHALTLDHLGGLIGQFLGGDPSRAPELPDLAGTNDRQAVRLARLLRAYEEHLPAAEMALLCRLCMLRRSVTEEQIFQFFLCSPAIRRRDPVHIIDSIWQLSEQHPDCRAALRGLRADILDTMDDLELDGYLAGPADGFAQALGAIGETYVAALRESGPIEVGDLLRFYADAKSDQPTDLRPLTPKDRFRVRYLAVRYAELREHPLLPFKEKLLSAGSTSFADFLKKPYFKKSIPPPIEDLQPSDVLAGLRQVERDLRPLAAKHHVLVQFRQLIRYHQRKWELAGPLAPLLAVELRQVLHSLVERRLLLREADGAFSVHPAVRDHFGRLAATQEQGAWHDLIREQLISLVQRPGRHLPEDRVTLDLVEEAIHHASQAGRAAEATKLYQEVLGGLRHLGWKLGEMARGLRILRGLQPCPDGWALAWFLRALGELEEAHAHNELACFRADIRLLQGRLPLVAAEGDHTRSAAAAFLMGQTTNLPPGVLACAMPRAYAMLYLGRYKDARRATRLDEFYRTVGWEGDRARCQLLAAEAERRLENADACRANLDAAATWILHSGSVEHLCLLHLFRARSARDAGDTEAAQRAVSAGLLLTRSCGLGLYHIELLCEQSHLMLDRADPRAAEAAAGEALWRATAADCRFAWGEAAASHLLGQSLLAQRRESEARGVLEKTLALRQQIGDPAASATAVLLR